MTRNGHVNCEVAVFLSGSTHTDTLGCKIIENQILDEGSSSLLPNHHPWALRPPGSLWPLLTNHSSAATRIRT